MFAHKNKTPVSGYLRGRCYGVCFRRLFSPFVKPLANGCYQHTCCDVGEVIQKRMTMLEKDILMHPLSK